MQTKNRRGLDRRNFLKASAAALVLGTLSTTRIGTGSAFAQGTNPDLEILNYALTLEHLEATAYRQVLATGLLSGTVRDYFQSFGEHEAAHVTALTQTIQSLGGTPVSAQANYAFPTFQSAQEVIEFFHMVEELGAAAYLGQAPRIQNDDLLVAAVSIHNVEGQHAAVLGDVLGLPPSPAFAEAKTMDQVLQVVRPLLQVDMPSQMPSTGLGGYARNQGRFIAY